MTHDSARRHSRKSPSLKARAGKLDARFSPTAIFSTDPPVATPTPPAATTDPATPVPPATTPVIPTTPSVTPVTPVVPSTTSAAPVTPPVVTTSSAPPVTSAVPTTTSAAPVTTSSSTPTTTSTSTSTTPTTSAVPVTSVAPPLTSTTVAIQTASFASASLSSAAASSTSSANTSSNISTGAVVGGIAAAGVAIAAVAFGAVFFIRRWKKRGADDDAWNAQAFRQSAVLVDDARSVNGNDSWNNGGQWNPRPPTMIERRIQHNMHDSVTSGGVGLVSAGNPPQMLSRQPSQAQASYAAYGGEPAYPSFHPGQIMSPPPTANTPDSWGQHTANAGPQDGWGEGSPFGSPYDSVQGPLLRQQSQQYGAPQPPLSRSGSVPPRYSQEPASAHYADLSRSSVTPFQAAQYEEISRKLQSPPAQALPALPEAREAISPFADPAEHEHEQSAAALRAVNDSPTLPERAHVPRVASVPPMLPEIASLGSGHGDAAPQAAAVPAPAPVARRSADATPAPEQKRPETVYDDSDVYGGI